MPFEIYSTEDLIGVIQVQQAINPYWLQMFPRTINSDREEILFDQITDGTRELAPFVAPNVQGRVLRERGYTTKTFRPAYVKPKHAVDPSRALPRLAGEAVGGSMTPQERYDAIVAENLRIEKLQIQNRWEWMACRATVDAQVTVVGDDYPAVTVNFNRDASLTKTLVTGSQWVTSNTAVDPLSDIEGMRRIVNRIANATITRLTFGLDAWAAFTSFQKVRDLLNQFYRGSQTEFNTAPSEGTPYEFRGILSGQNGIGRLELWTYSQFYRDDAGNTQDFLDSGTVVGSGPGMEGYQCFGAIKDRRAGLAPMSMFPKMWDEEDPSATYTMTQSAPLMVPGQPNGTFSMKVV